MKTVNPHDFWYYVPIIGLLYACYIDDTDLPTTGFNALSSLCQIIGILGLMYLVGIFDTTVI
jgi:hypothetical protein